MALITKLLVLFSLALSVNAFTASLALSSRALPGPHISHNILNHNRAVPRVVVQAVLTVAVPAAPKRKPPQDKLKSSCNSTASSSSTSSAPAASAPVNAAPSPVLTTTCSQAASDLALTSSFPSSYPTQAPELIQKSLSTFTPSPSTSSTSHAPPAQTFTSSSGSSRIGPSYLSGTQSEPGTFYETGRGACDISKKIPTTLLLSRTCCSIHALDTTA